jgi:hypothetical protein
MITTLAALVVGGAALAASPNDRGGMTGVGAIAASAQAPDAFERAAIRATATQAPDVLERAAIRAAAATPVRPDDRAGVRGPSLAPTGSVPFVAPAETGFQWGDASLGAGVVFGMLLVAGLVGLTIRRRGGPVSA